MKHTTLNALQKAAQINASVPPDETIYMNARITAPTVMHVHVATPVRAATVFIAIATNCNTIWTQVVGRNIVCASRRTHKRIRNNEKEASRPVCTDDVAP